MKPADRTRALNAAAIHIGWLTEQPHRRASNAITILADTTSRVAIDTGSSDNTGRRSIGGHSDPTASAAGQALRTYAAGARKTRQIRSTIRDVAESALFIRRTISGATPPETPPNGLGVELAPNAGTLAHALRDVMWSLTIPHAAAAWTTDDLELLGELDHACDHIHAQAAILHGQVLVVLTSAVRDRPNPEEQKPLRQCACCIQWGFKELAKVNSNLCESCEWFRVAYKMWPTESIRRSQASGRRRITRGQLIEAQARRKTKGKSG